MIDLYNYINDFFCTKEKEIFKYTESDKLTENNYDSFELTDKWIEISNLYKNLVVSNSLQDFVLKVSPYASDFIRNIYENCINDKTLLITSRYEHPHVVECQKKVKNKIKLSYDEIVNLNTENILSVYKQLKCDNILIYVVGTIPYNGMHVPQYFYNNLKEFCVKNDIKHTIVCDAVHELYLNNRNYNIFDYVVYNCKPLIQDFNMGMLWTKSDRLDFNYGYVNYERMMNYYYKLNIFKTHLNKLEEFQLLIKEFFSDIICSNVEIQLDTAKWIAVIKTTDLLFTDQDLSVLKEYSINLEDTHRFENYISMRIQSFINKDPDLLIVGLNRLKTALKRAIKRKTCVF